MKPRMSKWKLQYAREFFKQVQRYLLQNYPAHTREFVKGDWDDIWDEIKSCMRQGGADATIQEDAAALYEAMVNGEGPYFAALRFADSNEWEQPADIGEMRQLRGF